ncbi:MAG: DUF2520 domain-containing protein [Gemmatimonadaceae bacterium]
MNERIFVLGAGRAGLGLARAFRECGVDVAGVHGRRNSGGVDGVTTGLIGDAVGLATVVLVTVRDGELDAALRELALSPVASSAVVLHASGSIDPPALDALRGLGHPAGTFHPLVPLSDPDRAATILRGSWIGLDGDPEARARGRVLADCLGAHTLDIPHGQKARYHAAAVIASNFPAVLLTLGEKLLLEAGLPPRVARAALLPLFAVAADNLRESAGSIAITGPIVRGDVDTVRRNIEALAARSEALDVYKAMSRAVVELVGNGGTDPGALDQIRSLLR